MELSELICIKILHCLYIHNPDVHCSDNPSLPFLASRQAMMSSWCFFLATDGPSVLFSVQWELVIMEFWGSMGLKVFYLVTDLYFDTFTITGKVLSLTCSPFSSRNIWCPSFRKVLNSFVEVLIKPRIWRCSVLFVTMMFMHQNSYLMFVK